MDPQELRSQMVGSSSGMNAPKEPDPDDRLHEELVALAANSRAAVAYHSTELERHLRLVRACERGIIELKDVREMDLSDDDAELTQEQVARAGPKF